MERGLSSIVLLAVMLIMVSGIIILIRHNINDILIMHSVMLSELERKFNILSENVNVINNGSIYIKSDTSCPIRYLIVYNKRNVSILPVNNSSIRINNKLFNSTYDLYIVTCSGNIVRLYVIDDLWLNSTSSNSSILSVKPYFFQPGRKELLDPSICPIIFHEYNNSYGLLEVNTTFNLFCYNRSGLVYDPPIMYFYNIFLVSGGENKTINISLFSRGRFNIKYGTRNIVLYFLARMYDAITNSNIINISYPNILNLNAQEAVQETNLINNTTLYLYAWPRCSSTSIDGNFLLFLSYDLNNVRLSSTIMKIEEGFVITDKASVASASTITSVNYYIKSLFYNNSSFIVKKLPLNLTINYSRVGSSYVLNLYTGNGTVLTKIFNETNIMLLVNRPIYEDKYILVILEKIWLYNVLNEPVASVLLRVISKKALLSVLAYKTKEYLEIYNDAYPIKPTIEPLVVQRYYDGKILHRNEATHLFIQAHYITRYGGSPADIFIMRLPYIVVVTK